MILCKMGPLGTVLSFFGEAETILCSWLASSIANMLYKGVLGRSQEQERQNRLCQKTRKHVPFFGIKFFGEIKPR